MASTGNNNSNSTYVGPQALKGIRNPDLYPDTTNGLTPDDINYLNTVGPQTIEQNYSLAHGHIGYDELSNPALYKPQPEAPSSGLSNYGSSSFDQGIMLNGNADTVANQRAENEGTFRKWAAGFGKMAILAGTTAADGVAGTLVGIGNAAKAVAQGGDASQAFTALWDNPFSQAMQNINNWSEQALPNYQSTDEQQSPWWDNIFTSNFWANNIIKNIGFGVGAYLSGAAWSKALKGLTGLEDARNIFKGATMAATDGGTDVSDAIQAYKDGDSLLSQATLAKQLTDTAKTINSGDSALQLTGSFTGAFGAARQAAIQNSAEFMQNENTEIDNYANGIKQQYLQQLQQTRPDLFQMGYDNNGDPQITPSQQALQLANQYSASKFDADSAHAMVATNAAKMGNVDFALNVPVFALGDLLQFGRLYSRGFKTASRLNPIIQTIGDDGVSQYAAKNPGIFQTVAKTLKTGLAAGPGQMMMMQTAQSIPTYKYSSDLNSYYGATIDPVAGENTTNWMKASAKALLDTYGNADQWEQGFIGGLSGLLGVPGFRSAHNEEGHFQSPVIWQGGALGEVQNMMANNKATQAEVARLNSPDRLNYYQNLVRQWHYGQAMADASSAGDNFNYQNANDASLISDISTYSKANRLQDLKDIVNTAANITPDDVSKDGGIRDMTTDQTTGTNSIFPANMSDEDVVKKIQDNANNINKTIDNYSNTADNMETLYGGRLSQPAIDEMTYMATHVNQLEDRFNSLRQSVVSQLGTFNTENPNTEYTDKAGNGVQLSELLSAPLNETITKLGNNPDMLAAINKDFEDYSKNNKSVNNSQIQGDLQDLYKIASRRNNFIDTLAGYQANPQSLENDIQKETVHAQNISDVKKMGDIVRSLSSANSQQEFNQIYSNLAADHSTQDLDNARQALINSDSKVSKFADTNSKMEDYLSNLHTQMVSSGESAQTIKDASQLLSEHAFNADNMDEVTNPEAALNSATKSDILVNQPERKAKATDLLQKSMYNLNSELREKSDLSEAANTKLEGKPTPRNTDKEVTGSDKTATTAEANEESLGELTDEGKLVPPVGNTSREELSNPVEKEENVKQKDYYYPAVSEYQQDAMKNNDFIPLNATGDDKQRLVDNYNAYRQAHGQASIKAEDIDFNDIYNHIKDSGAFDYVNKGKLKVGDKIHFMIDPTFKGSRENPNAPTIFMTKKVGGRDQIVGSLPSASGIVNHTKGLSSLISRIYSEYNSADKSKPFIASDTTHVSQVMNGKVKFGSTAHNLADMNIDNPTLGIVKNNRLVTNNNEGAKVNTENIQENRDGSLYMLVPNSTGNYSLAKVRVKRYSELEDGDKTTAVKGAINNLALAASNGDNTGFGQALSQLNNELYTRDTEFHVHDSNNGKVLFIDNGDTHIPIYLDDKAGNPRSLEDISSDIENGLKTINPLAQVDANRINVGTYNKELINSGVLESNIDEPKVVGSWFTTNPLDERGKEDKAEILNYQPKQPVIQQGDKKIDLSSNKVADKNGIEAPVSQLDAELSQIRNSGIKIPEDGILQAPSGNLINMNTGKYLTPKEDFDYKVNKLVENNAFGKQLLSDQSNIDKTRTDSNYYYIKEDDGTFHQYERVHKALGNNSTEEEPVGELNNDGTITPIQEEKPAALQTGTKVDTLVRNFFTGEDTSIPEGMSEDAYNNIMGRLNGLKSQFNKNGETVLANNITLYHKYADGKRVAGEVDLMTIGKDGRVNIYDVKTSHYPFGYFNGRRGTTNYFENAGSFKKVSDKRYYSRQLAAYSNLLYSQYGIETNHLGLIPFVLNRQIDYKPMNDQQRLELGIKTAEPSPVISEKSTSMRDFNGAVVSRRLDLNQDEAFKDIENSIPKEASKRVITPTSNNSSNIASNADLNNIQQRENTGRQTRPKRPNIKNRLVTGEYNESDVNSELNWLHKTLPQVQDSDAVRIHKGLINVARLGAQAWGQFKNGMMIISDRASKGTVYHEAFHYVFNTLLGNGDKEILMNEARAKYGEGSNDQLEENLAEGFRNYVENKESVVGKIKQFFQDLAAKVFNWNKLSPVIDSYYQRINEGKYAEDNLEVNPIDTNTENNLVNKDNNINFADIEPETLDYMKAKGWTEDLWNNLSDREKQQAIKCATV